MSTSYDSFTLGDSPWYSTDANNRIIPYKRDIARAQVRQIPFSEPSQSITNLRKERLSDRLYTARERRVDVNPNNIRKASDRSLPSRSADSFSLEERIVRQGASRPLQYNRLSNSDRALVPVAEKVSTPSLGKSFLEASFIAKPLIDVYDGCRRYSQATSELIPSGGQKVIQTLTDEVNNQNQKTAIENQKSNEVAQIVEGVVETALIAGAILL